MAYFTQTLAGASIGNRFQSMASLVSERVAQYNTYRTTLSELSNLSDRELNDLGIDRTMIRSIAHEAAYQK